jgi:hypothetical protein
MKIKTLLGLAVLLTFAVGFAMAADIDGNWVSKTTRPNSDQVMETKYMFKVDGDKLTGTITGRGGEAKIEDGKIKGDKVSFKVKRTMGDNTVVMTYKGTLAGDEIKFTSSVEGADRPPRDFVANRVK